RGGILNIGSGAGLALMPAAAAYVGTKHFLHGFTEVLRLDLTGTGVVVTEVCPGPVETEFDRVAGIGEGGGGLPTALKVTAEQCAREAIAGFEKGKAMVFPGAAYKVLMAAQSVIPRPLQRMAMRGPSREARAETERKS
ncbi:MAG: SDR family NAD(P)-dependent oxidoreductase, partial [Gemmatimonadales bacterium]|nr:SDR family NAD(P)-dependent oxidoreductase [Gemmatimonadales bacterium]